MGGNYRAYSNDRVIKTLVIATAAAYGVDPIDRVFFDLKDLEGFKRECLEAKALGFVGKQVIHPSQIPIANEVFSPSQEEISWAERVVAAYEEAMRQGRGAIRLDDVMIDNVHYEIAKRILEIARRAQRR